MRAGDSLRPGEAHSHNAWNASTEVRAYVQLPTKARCVAATGADESCEANVLHHQGDPLTVKRAAVAVLHDPGKKLSGGIVEATQSLGPQKVHGGANSLKLLEMLRRFLNNLHGNRPSGLMDKAPPF